MPERLHEELLAPFEAEGLAMEMCTSMRGAVRLLPAPESVRWLVERQRTSIMASRRVLLSSEDWTRRLREMPADAPVVYLGPPLPSEVREPLADVARTRTVHLVIQAGAAYRQWLSGREPGGALHSPLGLRRGPCPFSLAALQKCRELVDGSRWSEIRICLSDDAGPELVAELHQRAAALEVPLCCEEFVGGGTSPVMGLLRLIAASDLAPDSLQLAGRSVSHELGVDASIALSHLARGLGRARTVPQCAALLVRAGRCIAMACPSRELHPGATERLLDQAERTAYRATSLPEWLAEVLRPRPVLTGHRDGVRVRPISRAALHAVKTTILPYDIELTSPGDAVRAYAVTAGSVVRLDDTRLAPLPDAGPNAEESAGQ